MKGNQDPRKRISALLNLDLPAFETIDQDLRNAFSILIDEPIYTVIVKVPGYDYEFELAPLREYEERLIAERTANLDVLTKQIIRRVEALTLSIIGVRTPNGETYSFLEITEKAALKQILLSLPTPIIDYLYLAFERMMAKYREKIREILGGSPEEVLTRNFFPKDMDNTEGNEF